MLQDYMVFSNRNILLNSEVTFGLRVLRWFPLAPRIALGVSNSVLCEEAKQLAERYLLYQTACLCLEYKYRLESLRIILVRI